MGALLVKKTMRFIDALSKKIDGEIITDDTAVLRNYSHDKSPFEIMPRAIVFPKTALDVQELVKFAEEHADDEQRITLTPRSAGTDVGGGPLGDSIIVVFTKYFNHIVRIGGDYAVVEPGVYFRDFEKATLAHNLLLPSFPASKSICALGGMLANNSGGEKTLVYGKTADYVQEMRVVLRDGAEHLIRPLNTEELKEKMRRADFEGEFYSRMFEIVDRNFELLQSARPRVSKNSAGYALWDIWDKKTFDLTRLFVGAQGTLGFITEARVRLIRPKEHTRMLVMFLTDLHQMAPIVSEVLLHKPETFEVYDKSVLKIILRFFPEFVKTVGGSIFERAWQFLPELKAVLLSLRLPNYILIAEFTGDDETDVAETVRAAEHALKRFKIATHVTNSEHEAEKYRAIRRDSFTLLQHHIHRKQTVTFIDDVIVRPELLPDFIPRLKQILDEYKLVYAIIGHVGDGNLHIIPLMDLSAPDTRRIIDELTHRVNHLVFEFHGSITAEHNDGLIRSPFLPEMFGAEVYALFKETKKLFDPYMIFNPRKKIDASFNYALDHLRHE